VAVMRKGTNMKYSVTWEDTDDVSLIVWKRKDDVTFTLVPAESLASSRRNSISSVGTASTGVSKSMCSSVIGADGIPLRIRPELLQKKCTPLPVQFNPASCESYISKESSQHILNNTGSSRNSVQTDEQNKEEALFEMIKAHCERNPGMLKKLVKWGMSNTQYRRVSQENIKNLSEGRFWVTAHPLNKLKNEEVAERLKESLEDLKGAYQQVEPGVYKQPKPQSNEPGVQHRLLKDSNGRWRIEEHSEENRSWLVCAKEVSETRWIDIKNETEIRVRLVPMIKIMQKIDEEFVESDEKVEKSMEFLFTACNQKKLNCKLTGRSLKHNIANCKIKLQKQHSLSFAVQVSKTADTIAQEMNWSGSFQPT